MEVLLIFEILQVLGQQVLFLALKELLQHIGHRLLRLNERLIEIAGIVLAQTAVHFLFLTDELLDNALESVKEPFAQNTLEFVLANITAKHLRDNGGESLLIVFVFFPILLELPVLVLFEQST